MSLTWISPISPRSTTLIPSLVYAATGADVQTVLVNGRVVVQDRRLLSFDLDETLARARELAGGLLAKKVGNLTSRPG